MVADARQSMPIRNRQPNAGGGGGQKRAIAHMAKHAHGFVENGVGVVVFGRDHRSDANTPIGNRQGLAEDTLAFE